MDGKSDKGNVQRGGLKLKEKCMFCGEKITHKSYRCCSNSKCLKKLDDKLIKNHKKFIEAFIIEPLKKTWEDTEKNITKGN